MKEVNCPSCKTRYFAISKGTYASAITFALVIGLACRFLMGNYMAEDFFGNRSVNLDKVLYESKDVKLSLFGLIGTWGAIGGVAGFIIGLAFDFLSRRCPQCGFFSRDG